MSFITHLDIEHIELPQNPIFIVGCPRSGTTLLQSLLATQDKVHSLIETHFFSVIIKKMELDDSQLIKTDFLNSVFESLKEYMDLEFSQTVQETLWTYSENGRLSLKYFFEIIVYSHLVQQVPQNQFGNIRWIEKTPSHFQCLDLISELYPKAKFLCIIRNPVPVILSRRENIMVDNTLSVTKLARQWNKMIKKVETFKNKFPDKIMIILYEDLVSDLIKTMTSVVNFLRIKLDVKKFYNFGETSSDFILPWEKWKDEVKTGKIQNTNSKWMHQAKILDFFLVYLVTGKYMRKYKYKFYQNQF